MSTHSLYKGRKQVQSKERTKLLSWVVVSRARVKTEGNVGVLAKW